VTDTPAGPPYELSFEISVDDIIDASRLHQKRLTNILTWTGLLLIGGAGLLATLGIELWIPALLVFYGALLLIYSQGRALARWRVGRAAKSLVGRYMTVKIGRNGVDVNGPESGNQLAWDGLSTVLSDDRVVLLKRDKVPVFWIPTSAFTSPEERIEVETYMRNQITAAHGGGR
jgi:hypothetical protein